jgi:hypothetical protein
MLRNKRGTKKQVPNKVSFFLNVIWEIKKGISFQYGVISPWVYIGDAGERLPVFENCCPSPSHSYHFRCHQRTIDHWSWGRIVKNKTKRNKKELDDYNNETCLQLVYNLHLFFNSLLSTIFFQAFPAGDRS